MQIKQKIKRKLNRNHILFYKKTASQQTIQKIFILDFCVEKYLFI